jgi:hypothetical protein
MFTIITIHIKNPLKNPVNIFPRLQETVEPGFAGRRGWILPQETLGATALNVGNERIIAATPSNPSIPYVKRTSEMTNISKNEDATFFFQPRNIAGVHLALRATISPFRRSQQTTSLPGESNHP